MKGKKGISIVVVSTFIILLTVVLITITWLWIVPWTQDIDSSNNANANLRIVLGGYTAFDVEHDMAFIQIERGADAADIVALDIIFNVDGNSYVFRTYNSPKNNQVETYVFNFSKAGIVEVPQFVEVAGVYSNREIGVAMGDVAVPVTKVYLDDWAAAGVKADKNYLKDGAGSVEEIPSEPVDICKDDFAARDVYVLSEDIQVTEGNNCFVIDVDDVVLDLNGHLIRGVNYSGYGVHIIGRNVTVKNGRIEGFEKGVFIDGAPGYNSTIVKNEFFDNNYSVYIELSSGNSVLDNEMSSGNYANIYLDYASNNYVANNRACGSPRGLVCRSSDNILGYGEENYFNSVLGCSTEWSELVGGYTGCED